MRRTKQAVDVSTLPNGDFMLICGGCRLTLYKDAVARDPEIVNKTVAKLSLPPKDPHPTKVMLRIKREKVTA